MQLKWYVAAADGTVFVFDDKAVKSCLAFAQQIDGRGILEVDLRWLGQGMATEAGTTVVGMAFQVQRIVQSVQEFGFATAGQSAQLNESTLLGCLVQRVDQETTQSLIATHHHRVVDARFMQPLLGDA